ncbi:hypothetical protein D3C85_1155190 [compost metagenome]
MCDLGTIGRKGFIMKFFCGIRIQRKVKLIFPSEFEPRLAQCIVPVLRTRMSFGKIGRMGCDLVSDYPVFYVFLIRKPEVFFWRYITQHRRSKPTDHRGSDG